MASLVYNCPHCGVVHRVDDSLIGDRIDCRDCGLPFKAAIPLAQPAEGGANIEVPESHCVTAGQGEIEDAIVELHPSMARQSPLTFGGLILAILAGIAGIVIGGATSLVSGGLGTGLVILGAVLLVAGLGWLLLWWIQTLITTLTITDHRTRLRKGLFSRDTTEVRHDDVRNLKVEQGVIDNLLNVGTISISSAGQGDLEIIVKGISNPDRVTAIIRDLQ